MILRNLERVEGGHINQEDLVKAITQVTVETNHPISKSQTDALANIILKSAGAYEETNAAVDRKQIKEAILSNLDKVSIINEAP
jgi:hypothetical protein